MATKLETSNTGQDYVPYTKYEEYSERFAAFFTMKRVDGIIHVRHHAQDDPEKEAVWHYGIHKGWGQLFKLIGQDPENEVLIISGTGSQFLTGMDPKNIKSNQNARVDNPRLYLEQMYPMYRDGSDLVYNIINDVHIPTIGVINGTSVGHTEFPLLCDLTLITPETILHDGHYSAGVVPGDGQHLIFDYLVGSKRSNYLAYMGKSVDAQTALDWGMVNEVVTLDKVVDRAWEIARHIMKQERVVRRLTRDMIREPLRQYVTKFFPQQFALEWWGCADLAGKPLSTEGIGFFNKLAERGKDDMV